MFDDKCIQALREYLWLSHGHQSLYGDDGEMQCSECHADYKRDALGDLIHKAVKAQQEVNLVKMKERSQELSLVPFKDIIEELGKRFDHFVFSGVQVLDEKNNKLLTERRWEGNSATCCGLCHQLQYVITKDHFNKTQIITDDDDKRP